jgi:hypothetical protein
LAQFGQEQVDASPAQPQFPTLALQNLAITKEEQHFSARLNQTQS